MLQATRRLMHLLIGTILIIFGIFGLVLPIVNGTILLIIGCIILSFEIPYIEKKLFSLTRRNKMIHRWHIALEKMLRRLFRK